MLLRQLNDAHLTYCTNVHPGESLSDVRALIEQHVVPIKAAVSPDQRFGVGLRLAAAAASELETRDELARFRAELAERGLYCFTLNGFPYGAFHGARVKERVYQPDWLSAERVRYTQGLARVLSELLPLGVSGSISTVPGCFRPAAQAAHAERRMALALVEVAATLVDLARTSGRDIALALEPEPHCFLETADDAVRFFEQHVFGRKARDALVTAAGVAPNDAERLLRRHLGVCLDTCHASVEFESPLDAWRRLRAAGIAVRRYTADQVCVIPGTQAVAGITQVDEPVGARRGPRAERERGEDAPRSACRERHGSLRTLDGGAPQDPDPYEGSR